ncbi:Receptor-like protein kinase HSL1 [Hordeum vulgare]|nr:Receptor-like protein kinase HSL1 [Hordeum vulgare]
MGRHGSSCHGRAGGSLRSRPQCNGPQHDIKAFQSFEAFKARHKNKLFTLTHCWVLIKDCAKFKDQYNALKKKGGKKVVANEGDLLKRPRGKTNLKADERHDASSIALQGTLRNMMSQEEVRDDRMSKGNEEQMKIYLEVQTKKLDMEEATERRKLDMEEAMKRRKLNIEEAAQLKKLNFKATMADTKAKEVELAFMIVDKTNMSPKRKAWFANQQKEMFARDGLN